MSDAEVSAQDGLPRVLLFAVALICGLFLALAVHIALTGTGNGLAGPWRDLFPPHAAELKAAFAWWAIALSGCLGSFFAILLLRAAPPRGSAPRIFRLSLGIIFFGLLAAAGHGVAAAPPGETIATAATNLAAMSLGGFMAFCTTHFALSAARAKK
jgi:hypothetical protein